MSVIILQKIKLKQKIREIINNNKKFKNRIIDKKKFYFSYINDSAKNISVFWIIF